MTFAAPEFAWLLLPLLLPAAALLARRQRLTWAPSQTRPWRAVLWLPAGLLLVAALCRPQWGEVSVRQENPGRDFLFALDVSRSMLADDLAPRRLAAAKQAIARLLPELQGDRLGLLAFAGTAFLVCPLTQDQDAFARALEEAGPDSLPLGGSNLAAALNEAQRALSSGAGKTLILLTDGEDHAGGAPEAARALAAAGITLHVVGVGAPAGGLLPLETGDFVRDRQGALVRSRLDAATLAALAQAGGGRLMNLGQDALALQRLHDETLSRQALQTRSGERRVLQERFQIPLGLALALLVLAELLPNRRRL